MKPRHSWALACAFAVTAWGTLAHATKSAEYYTNKSYQYGRFEASIRFPAGSGVVGSFFLWKDGSELDGEYWNELDLEKVGADCTLDTNAFYGDPERVHTKAISLAADLCGAFHTYTYEWTPEYIAWFVDGTEVRRETGETATAYAENATEGMQLRFNIWPGDASFGGVFDPSVLPVYEQIDWVQYSSYADGAFTLAWREDFDAGTAPSGWSRATWDSPKGLSTHATTNVSFADGYAVLALTDDAGSGTGGTSAGTGGTSAGTGGTMGTGGADAPQTGGSTAVGTGGSTAAGGNTGPGTVGDTRDESGCACRAGARGPRNALGIGWLLGAVLVGGTRRRRMARPHGRRP